jgi:hypothetical protein
MSSRIVRSIALTILILCVAAGFAAPAAFAEDGWLDLLNGYKTSSKANRLIIAKGMLEEVYEPIDAQVPNLKPDEKAWIEKEKKDLAVLLKSGAAGDAYAKKQAALMATPEYHIHTLKERLGNIEDPLRNIVKRTKALSLAEEMGLWAQVVYWITFDPNEFDNNFAFLEKEKRINTKAMKGLVRYGVGNDYWYHQTRYANTVQGAIVLQYLQGDIKK